jgi:hypothetical protein
MSEVHGGVIRFLAQNLGVGDNMLRRPVSDSSSSSLIPRKAEEEEDLLRSHET